jgi:predicted RND superfamily exporter protein
MSAFFERLSGWVARAPARWLLLVLLSLAPAAWMAAQLPLEGSFTALLPERDRAVLDLRAGIARTGGSAYTVVAVGAADRPAAERYADALAAVLSKHPDVRYVEARRELDFLRQRALYYLPAERLQKIVDDLADEIDQRTVEGAGLGIDLEEPAAKTSTRTPLVDLDTTIDEELAKADVSSDPYSVGKDGKYLYVFVALRGNAGDLAAARGIQAAVERIAHEVRDGGGHAPSLELRFSGSLLVRLEDEAYLRSDLTRASTLGFCAVVGLLVLYTRRVRTLVLLSVPLLAGISWTFAFAWVAVGRLNIISGFLATILSGLGVEFGIHLLLRYIEARRRGDDVDAAMATSMRTTGRSLVGSGLTNAGAFFVVSFAGFEGFSEFGLIAGVGMIITLLLTLVAFPAINLALERWRPMVIKPLPPAREDGIHVPKPLRAVVLVVMPLMVLVSLYFIAQGQPRFRTNWREIKGESAASDFGDYITQSLGASLTQSAILVDDKAHVPEVVKILDSHVARRKAAGLPTGITTHLSVDDLVPPDQQGKIELLAELDKQLARIKPERLDDKQKVQLQKARTLASAQPFMIEQVPASLKQRLLTEDGRGTLVLLRTDYQFYESAELIDWANELDELSAALRAAGIEAPIISENWIAGRIFQIITGDGPFILGATIVVVFLVIFGDFRRLGHAALVMGTLLCGVVSVAGAMALLGMELNFMNVAVLPIVVGVSIDNAVHIYHRYLEEGPASIPLVLRHTVAATTLSSATNLMGFGAMIVAHHGGLRSVAELAILGVGLTFFSTSVFFPLALEWWGERRAARA